MRSAKAMVIVLVLGLAGTAAAQDEGTGIGIIVGEPTGLSLKKWVSTRTAVAGALAWAFDPNTSFHVHGDYLFHDYDIVTPDKGRLPLYGGLGARLKFEDEKRGRDKRTRVGVRIPLGLNYHFEQAPVDLFLEIVPILDVAPRTDVSLNAAVGARYFFR
jgi:hypothetical protein